MVIHECAKIIQIDPLGFDKMIFKVYPITDPTHSQLFFFNQSKLIWTLEEGHIRIICAIFFQNIPVRLDEI